jgi:diguanylate cyclase (GGDEF)-like protein
VQRLSLHLAPLLALVLLTCALGLPLLTAADAEPLLPAVLWSVLVAVPSASAGLVAWGRHRRAALPDAAPDLGAHVALLLIGGAALGLAAADLTSHAVATAGWRLLPVPVIACVAALATVVARPLRFAVFAATCLAPLALVGGKSAPALAATVVGLYAVLVLASGVLSRVLTTSLRSEAEQRARLSRLEFTNEALFADRQQLHTESRTDPLTGLANRRQMEETLQSEWNRCRRSASPLSCILLDVDHFKSYNDCYGHDGGDMCLRRIAALLGENSRRPGDVVARIGGEEFVLLLPETGPEGASTVADLLKHALAQADLPHEASPTAPRVTVSMGVATLVPEAARIPEELLKAADLALYEAKRAGRDCVVMADRRTLESARLAARGLIG